MLYNIRSWGGNRIRQRSGFGLVEFVICLAILTLAIIFLVEIFGTMLGASTKGADWSVATYIAAAKLDQLTANPSLFNSLYSQASGNVLNVSPMVYAPGATEPAAVASVNNTTYYIRYTFSKLNNSATPDGTLKELYSVDAAVSWFGTSPQNGPVISASGYGKVSTHMERLIYMHADISTGNAGSASPPPPPPPPPKGLGN